MTKASIYQFPLYNDMHVPEEIAEDKKKNLSGEVGYSGTGKRDGNGSPRAKLPLILTFYARAHNTQGAYQCPDYLANILC